MSSYFSVHSHSEMSVLDGEWGYGADMLTALKKIINDRIVRGRKQDDCWEWSGAHDPDGYGVFQHRAHRLVYEVMGGDIPDGMDLDHVCQNRGCVNPAHMAPESPDRNRRQLRKERSTHCGRGHEWTLANTRINTNGKRACRACQAQRNRDRYQNDPEYRAKRLADHARWRAERRGK